MYEKINQLNTEINELETLLAQKKAELVNAKAELPLVEEMVEICESHGFKVSRNGSWLWKTGTDGRYDTQQVINAGKLIGNVDVTSKDAETKILLDLGFKYSSNRGAFYWIEDETTRKVKVERNAVKKQDEFTDALMDFRSKNECSLSDNNFEWNFINDVMFKDYKKLSNKQKECLLKILNKHDNQIVAEIQKFWEA